MFFGYTEFVMKENNQNQLKQLRTLSVLLDSQFEGPFGIRFGLDGILGFVPFIGDFVTTGISFYILVRAAQLGASTATLSRMALNLFFENFVDMVPVLGSFFDVYWKANNRNIKILEAQLREPKKTARASKFILLSLLVFLFVLFFSMVYLSWILIQQIFTSLIN